MFKCYKQWYEYILSLANLFCVAFYKVIYSFFVSGKKSYGDKAIPGTYKVCAGVLILAQMGLFILALYLGKLGENRWMYTYIHWVLFFFAAVVIGSKVAINQSWIAKATAERALLFIAVLIAMGINLIPFF